MEIFAAVPLAIIIYFFGVVVSFKFSIYIFDTPQDFQDYQLLIIFIMGLFAAMLVKLFVRIKYHSSFFGHISLLLIGLILGFSAVFSYVRNLGVMECGLEYLETFAILSVVALIFGTRKS